MRNSKIEWCTMSWNPVTGCFHGCKYCYARSIARRFAWKKGLPFKEEVLTKLVIPKPIRDDEGKVQPYPAGFNPTFHKYRLDEPARVKEPQNIFVCSMADLFGDWVPVEWIRDVFDACLKAPQHNYLFLTKNPERYVELKDQGVLVDLPNMWYGTSVTKKSDPFIWFDKFANWFISVEPILEDLGDYHAEHLPNWVVCGAETGNRKGKVVPDKAWIESLMKNLPGVPILMKDSLVPIMGEENMRREFPDSLRVNNER